MNSNKIQRNLAQQNQQHPVYGGCNSLTIGYLKQTQKCIQTLDKMGLQVQNIEFNKIKPKIRVQPNHQTTELEQTEQAIPYIQGNDGVHFTEYQIIVEGIKVVWRSYLN